MLEVRIMVPHSCLMVHVVCPIIGNNRHNRDVLDSNNRTSVFFISPNTNAQR